MNTDGVIIGHTRAIVNAVLDGKLADVPTEQHSIFGLRMPTACPNVPAQVLDPRNPWEDKQAHDRQARLLAERFAENFEKYSEDVSDDIRTAGPAAA